MTRTAERTVTPFPFAKRLPTVNGATLGLFDISKPGGATVFDGLEAGFANRHISFKRFVKPTFGKVAPAALLDEVAASGCTGVVLALAD